MTSHPRKATRIQEKWSVKDIGYKKFTIIIRESVNNVLKKNV